MGEPDLAPLVGRALGSLPRCPLRPAGNRLPQRDVPDVSFDTWVRDLETVVDAAGLDRFPLLGISRGGPVAIAYAVKHPERVTPPGALRRVLSGAEPRRYPSYFIPCMHSFGSMTPRLLTILKLPLFAWAMYMFIRT